MIAYRCHSFSMGCKIDPPPSGNGYTPKPRQMWGGDLCTTPVKEFREPEAPRGDGLATSGPGGPQLPKALQRQNANDYWPRRAVCRLRTGATVLLARESRLRSYHYQPRRGPGGPKTGDCGALFPCGKGCTGWPSVTKQAKCT